MGWQSVAGEPQHVVGSAAGGNGHETSQDEQEGQSPEFPARCQGAPEERPEAADARRLASVGTPVEVPCYSPLKAFRVPGQAGVSFERSRLQADLPVDLPCGQCIGCRVERSRQWALRCVHESQIHRENSFITLTYDDEHLPADLGLQVEHWQKFMKRLRKKFGKVRFFHCGEYGESNLRPHYHAILFGLNFKDKELFKLNEGKPIYVSESLARTWGQGFVTVGPVTYESCAYVSRYVMKKVNGRLAESHYSRIDKATGECWSVRPEYVTMSRRPGIGHGWLQRFKSDVFPSDEVVHEGRRFRPPRYYDKQLGESELEEMKEKRRKAVGKFSHELTPDRLAVRESVAAARLSRLRREL